MRKQKRGKNKKAVFFSLDALIALSIILLTILVIYPIIRYSEKESYVPEDIISSLSALKIGDMNNSLVNQWKEDRNITNFNKSVLEQIGEFYIDDNTKPMARALAEEVINTIDTRENIGIWYGDELLASKNKTSLENAKEVSVERQTISGIQEGNATTGYSARAFLTDSVQTKYFYFGGYVGEGNITARIDYNGTLENVELEITANKQFRICINEEDYGCSGSLEPVGSEFNPKYFPLFSGYHNYFKPGINSFKIISADGSKNLHVAGGYLKITYKDGVRYEQPVKYYFPGIEGLINIYDGFYVPGTLNEMEVFLHYNSNYTIFLNIGNVSVFSGKHDGETNEIITDTTLKSKLNYNSLSNQTIPIRLGMENVSYTQISTKLADVFSVTDISGSMGDCANYYKQCTYYCESPHLASNHTLVNRRRCNISITDTCAGTICGGLCTNPHSYSSSNLCNNTKLDLAKSADNIFIDIVLNNTGNRVGLVGYSTSALDSNYYNLSNNSVSLKNEVNSWDAGGGTCICCGINRAVNALNTTSSPDKFQSIVIMSDGQPTYYCSSFDSYTQGGGDGSHSTYLEQQWSINASCHAWKNHGIRVYTIGFGSDVNETTLRAMATCGNGSYYYADVSNLVDIYQQIAQDIIEASYNEQTIELIAGNISTFLYPDSYIQFNYTKKPIPYGLISTIEKNFSDAYSGSFILPANSSILETKVISYSGPRWTKEVSINGNTIYNLSKYKTDYIKLGDPYTINIPNSYVYGDNFNNIINLTTGTSSTNTSAGSSSNKIIYTILKNMVSYSAISQSAKGCNWSVQFEDGANLTLEVPAEATEECYYKQVDGLPVYKYEKNDALQNAVYKLFKKLDFDENGRIDIKFTEQNLEITSSEIKGIPYPYETEVQVRKWW